ncbi:hypothetical protein PUR_43870 [Paenibacillus sp. URB8-2]|nr:hypothetical protein PUR_43870 [Paenibacillus sp. URB8-2]
MKHVIIPEAIPTYFTNVQPVMEYPFIVITELKLSPQINGPSNLTLEPTFVTFDRNGLLLCCYYRG